jgi:predicted MFS family arabinose efflux permease
VAASSYRVLLRSPAVRWQALSGLLAQTTQGAGGIGIILVIRGHNGSLALAGAVVGALSLAAGLARPVQGRLIDRRGAGRLMVVCGVVHPAALAAVVALADRHAAGAGLVAMGALAGVTLPPVSTCMRVAWGGASAGDRTSAYSLVYLTQELSILTGPLLLSALVATTDASAALTAVAALACAGTLGFAASLPDDPERRLPLPAQRSGGVLRAPGMRALIGAAVLMGAVIGAVEMGVPTSATAHHAPAATGLLIAILSIGGIAGAAIYGGRRWALTPTARLLVLLSALSVAVALTVVSPDLVLLGAVLALAGLPLNPSLTTISVLVDSHVSAASAAEAFGWLSSGLSGGTGAASAIAGAVSQPGQPRPAFVVAAAAAVAAALLVAGARRALARPADTP